MDSDFIIDVSDLEISNDFIEIIKSNTMEITEKFKSPLDEIFFSTFWKPQQKKIIAETDIYHDNYDKYHETEIFHDNHDYYYNDKLSNMKQIQIQTFWKPKQKNSLTNMMVESNLYHDYLLSNMKQKLINVGYNYLPSYMKPKMIDMPKGLWELKSKVENYYLPVPFHTSIPKQIYEKKIPYATIPIHILKQIYEQGFQSGKPIKKPLLIEN